MANSFLTPLQRAFLQAFFAEPVGQRFFLTGGTALVAFYLYHRLSDDLDLFTLDDLALEAAVRPIETIASGLDCTLQRTRVSQHFQQFLRKRKRRERSRQKQARREPKRQRARPDTRAVFPFRPPTHRLAGIPDERTLMAGLMEIETLGDEPEFADFTLGEDIDDIISEMMAESDEDIQRLEAAGQEEEIDLLMSEARMSAMGKAVTPAVRADICRRLDQLSRRQIRQDPRPGGASGCRIMPL